MSKLDSGLQAWRQMTNHNRMIEIQERGGDVADPTAAGEVEIAFFGSSSFRITTPNGISLMVDPWRNFPNEKWDWYFRDFPHVLSTSASPATLISTMTPYIVSMHTYS